jgi:D-cysteine desulfhydrase
MITELVSGISILRDDLFPFLGGGNKGRKIQYIAREIIEKGANAIVTTGGIESNHCRAAAILAAQNGWQCTLVIHGDEEAFYRRGGNALLMRSTNANLVFVNPEEIGEAMNAAMNTYRDERLVPYYIYGGGHTMQGGLAYIDAVSELKAHLLSRNATIDYIFLASGTGSTQAGILAGLDKVLLDIQVIGISVGRARERAESVVSEFYSELCECFDIPWGNKTVTVLDDFLSGGYGHFNSEIKELSMNSVRNYGFTLDTTYTAKAFYGMQQYIIRNNLKGNVLFWHTGGVLNFLAEN